MDGIVFENKFSVNIIHCQQSAIDCSYLVFSRLLRALVVFIGASQLLFIGATRLFFVAKNGN